MLRGRKELLSLLVEEVEKLSYKVNAYYTLYPDTEHSSRGYLDYLLKLKLRFEEERESLEKIQR